MRNYFTFAGHSSADFGVTIVTSPAVQMPERQVETISIPGRNGDLHIDGGGYGNALVEYHCNASGGADKASAIAAWLYSAGTGYHELSDSYATGCFRQAVLQTPLDITVGIGGMLDFWVRFSCRPEKFLASGQAAISMAAPGTVANPTTFQARPLVKVIGNYSGGNDDYTTITINGTVIKIFAIDESLMLDSDTQNAYKGNASKNADIFCPDFPVLSPGDNSVAWSTGITSVEIKPRWWTL